MAKFKAGEMIQRQGGIETYLVSRVLVVDNKYSFYDGKEMYSLDNGVGWFQESAEIIDAEFQKID